MGFRADPVELRGLETREGGEYPEYRCRVPLRGITKVEHSGYYHGTPVGRSSFERADSCGEHVEIA